MSTHRNEDPPTKTTNGTAPTNGTEPPLDLRTITRSLAQYAMTGEPVCVLSERHGVTFVAVGRVVLVTDRICIISRQDNMGRRLDPMRPERHYDGESFCTLQHVTRIEPAPTTETFARIEPGPPKETP